MGAAGIVFFTAWPMVFFPVSRCAPFVAVPVMAAVVSAAESDSDVAALNADRADIDAQLAGAA